MCRYQDLEDPEGSVEVLLNKYIPSVTIVGAVIIGLFSFCLGCTECIWFGNRNSINGGYSSKLLYSTCQRTSGYTYAQIGGYSWQKIVLLTLIVNVR